MKILYETTESEQHKQSKKSHLFTFDGVVRPGVSSKIYLKKQTHMYCLTEEIDL